MILNIQIGAGCQPADRPRLLGLWRRRHFGECANRFNRGWHAAVLRDVNDQLLDFLGRDAEVQRTAHVQPQLGSSPERHQRRHRYQRTQLDRQAGAIPDGAEQLFVEKGGEPFVEVSQERIAVLRGFLAPQLRAHFHSFFR